MSSPTNIFLKYWLGKKHVHALINAPINVNPVGGGGGGGGVIAGTGGGFDKF